MSVDRDALAKRLQGLATDLAYADDEWGSRAAVDEQLDDCAQAVADLVEVIAEIKAYRGSLAYAKHPPHLPEYRVARPPVCAQVYRYRRSWGWSWRVLPNPQGWVRRGSLVDGDVKPTSFATWPEAMAYALRIAQLHHLPQAGDTPSR